MFFLFFHISEQHRLWQLPDQWGEERIGGWRDEWAPTDPPLQLDVHLWANKPVSLNWEDDWQEEALNWKQENAYKINISSHCTVWNQQRMPSVNLLCRMIYFIYLIKYILILPRAAYNYTVLFFPHVFCSYRQILTVYSLLLKEPQQVKPLEQ